MMTNEMSNKIVKFMTSGTCAVVPGCGHISHIVNMHYLITNLLNYTQA